MYFETVSDTTFRRCAEHLVINTDLSSEFIASITMTPLYIVQEMITALRD